MHRVHTLRGLSNASSTRHLRGHRRHARAKRRRKAHTDDRRHRARQAAQGGGAVLYCWSSGGGDYARRSAEEVGLADCFSGFLPKPNVVIDDQEFADWRRFAWAHPNSCASQCLESYRKQLEAKP